MYSNYGIEETTSVEKTSIILFGIKEKQLRFENSFYCVFIERNDYVVKFFNNSLLSFSEGNNYFPGVRPVFAIS